MDINEYIGRLSQVEAHVKRDFQRACVTAANDLVSGVTLRVVNQGLNANGKPFSPYSPNVYYASSFKSKGRNDSSDSRISALGTTKISYGQFRGINNLNTSPKNFAFTGDLWKNYGVLNYYEGNGTVTVNIGTKTPSATAKMEGNSKREGIEIGSASQAEEAEVRQDLENWLANIFNQHGI